VRHANIFALGDVTATPNSKTAAAVRKQAPVVARNILRLMNGRAIEGGYDGYASCPLTTANGKAIIAEFVYGGKVTPTLPLLNPGKERWLGWWIKMSFLPILYWKYMLKGYGWFPKRTRRRMTGVQEVTLRRKGSLSGSSRITGTTILPKLWRMPMPRLIITETPSRMATCWRSALRPSAPIRRRQAYTEDHSS
jgi:hypothetical protein